MFSVRLSSSTSGIRVIGIEHDVFEHRAEAGDRRIDLGLGGRRQVDHLGVAAALEIEDALGAPAVLVVADQGARGVGRQASSCRCRESPKKIAQSPFGPTLAEQCIGKTSRAGNTKLR